MGAMHEEKMDMRDVRSANASWSEVNHETTNTQHQLQPIKNCASYDDLCDREHRKILTRNRIILRSPTDNISQFHNFTI